MRDGYPRTPAVYGVTAKSASCGRPPIRVRGLSGWKPLIHKLRWWKPLIHKLRWWRPLIHKLRWWKPLIHKLSGGGRD